MELNTRGRYAVMAMADLAHRAAVGPAGGAAQATCVDRSDDAIPLSAVADRQHISLAYLEQLFAKLRRAGLVESARGRSGGYRLGRAADQITIAEIMHAVDEGVRMTRCDGDGIPTCLPGERCLTHGLWDALGAQINHFLAGVSLQDVLDGRLGRHADTRPTATPASQALFTGGVVPR